MVRLEASNIDFNGWKYSKIFEFEVVGFTVPPILYTDLNPSKSMHFQCIVKTQRKSTQLSSKQLKSNFVEVRLSSHLEQKFPSSAAAFTPKTFRQLLDQPES